MRMMTTKQPVFTATATGINNKKREQTTISKETDMDTIAKRMTMTYDNNEWWPAATAADRHCQWTRALELDNGMFEVDVLDVGNKGESFIYNHIKQQGFLFRTVYEIAHFFDSFVFVFVPLWQCNSRYNEQIERTCHHWRWWQHTTTTTMVMARMVLILSMIQ